ncbi:hypothetical protein EGR_10850 [Echinococcus granulosus]|uniref:Uncharacterized protein n=1 Tax=Echinococcus granulosus TaxID=6210 RepID=W6UL99_ECHGR|nr:hypothetical protein EGR_10850 [Echinococcus granulosus]EUB54289.1 hypothetical protein EGR_10850 [Echinococcus granulosus]
MLPLLLVQSMLKRRSQIEESDEDMSRGDEDERQ